MRKKILIGGDVCPIGRNQHLFRSGNALKLINDLMPEFEKSSLSIVNLESPLIRRETPIEKIGPNLGVPVDCARGLKAMGIDVVGLANNHIMDHASNGLRSTIGSLEKYKIAFVGAGENLEEARKIMIREIGGIRIGILAMAEHEFGIATKTEPGVNPLNMIDAIRNMRTHRDGCDFLIVLVHGGNEHYIYPPPHLLDTCRLFIEEGASAVICQHSHCSGCMEMYSGSPIVYGQGNFIFDMATSYPTWYVGFLVKLEICKTGRCNVNLIPFRQSDGILGARRMTSEQAAKWRLKFDEYSRCLSNPIVFNKKWREYCRERRNYYLNKLNGTPSILRRIAGKLNLLRMLDGPEKQRARLNIIRCESHRDALINILESESMPMIRKRK